MTTVVTAASIVGCSNDLVPEILVHLPAKTLLRLKVVSKKWKLIISDIQFAVNQFRKTHNSSVSPTGGLFLYHLSDQRHKPLVSLPLFGNPPGSVPPLTLPHKLPLDFPYTKINFQSCNGLLLCIFSGFGSGGIHASLCAVCNPTFGYFKFLPNPPVLGTDHRYDGYTLVFNPFESHHHYSVVAIRRTCSDVPKLGAGELYSFSSETKRWEFRHVIDGVEMMPSAHRGWFWNDTVYWIGEKLMHYYKVNSQEFGSLDLPPEITRVDTRVSTAELFAGGHFYIVERDWNAQRKGEFKIFEFDNVNMKWLNPHIYLLNSDHFGTNPVPLAVVRGKKKRDFLFVFAANPDLPDTLMIYDLVMHKLVETHALKSILYANTCDYVPSLIPV